MCKVLKDFGDDTEERAIEDACIGYTQLLLNDGVSTMRRLVTNAKGEKVKWWIENCGCSKGHAADLLEALADYEASSVSPSSTRVDAAAMDSIVTSLISVSHGHIKPFNIPFDAISQWTGNFTSSKLIGSGGFGDVYEGYVTGLTKHLGKTI